MKARQRVACGRTCAVQKKAPRRGATARDPVVDPGEPYGVLLELVACMPTSLADGSFRRVVEAAQARLEPLADAIR